VGKDEIEVRREDQDKINKFSRLHQREMLLEDDLKIKAVRIVSSKPLDMRQPNRVAERQRRPRRNLQRA